VTLVVAAGAACATEADPGDVADVVAEARQGGTSGSGTGAGTRALAAASDLSSSEAYRVTVSMRMDVSDTDPRAEFTMDSEVMTGAVDGDAYEMHMDMGGAFADLGVDDGGAPAPAAPDLTMDIAGDRETAYIRAPMFAELAELDPEAGLPPGDWTTELADLGDRWGRVDLTAVEGLAPGDVPLAMAGPGVGDPADALEMVAGAERTEDLGTDEIDGVEVHGTRFVVTLADLMGDQAAVAVMPPADAADAAGDVGDEEALDALGEAMLSSDLPVEVWIDGDGFIRRIAYDFDMASLFGSLPDVAGGEGPSMAVGVTMDFADYGDPGITIRFPDDADTVDITDAFRSMMGG
jgi:hypothetical protein